MVRESAFVLDVEMSAHCWCGRFRVPTCCGRYLEDISGRLVHTPTVCYSQDNMGNPVPLNKLVK